MAEGCCESRITIRDDIGGSKDGHEDVGRDTNRVESLTFFGAEDFVRKIDHPAVWEATGECVGEEPLGILTEADHAWITSQKRLGEGFAGTLRERANEFDDRSTEARTIAGMNRDGLRCGEGGAVRWTAARLFREGEVISSREPGGDGKTKRIAAAEVDAEVENEGAEVGIRKDRIQSGFENAEIALDVATFRIPPIASMRK